jgi:hypothetical protein
VRRAALAKIAGDHIGLDRIRVDKFGGDLVEPRLVARNQNDGMTMRGKFAGEFETDATRGAGDQRAAAVLGSICHVPALPSRKRGATSERSQPGAQVANPYRKAAGVLVGAPVGGCQPDQAGDGSRWEQRRKHEG